METGQTESESLATPTRTPEQSWEVHVAAMAHILPIFWFLPKARFLPLVVWLIWRKKPYIAQNAREASLFWISVHIILQVIAWIVGWGWLQTLVWCIAAMWGAVAAFAKWNGLATPYPLWLRRAAAYWEDMEPGAIDGLWKNSKALLAAAKESGTTSIQQSNLQSMRTKTVEETVETERPPVAVKQQQAQSETTSVLQARIPSALTRAFGCGLLGAVLGIPLSYWFQPGMMRSIISLPDYVGEVIKGLQQTGGRMDDPFGVGGVVIQTMVFSGIAGVILGAIWGNAADGRVR